MKNLPLSGLRGGEDSNLPMKQVLPNGESSLSLKTNILFINVNNTLFRPTALLTYLTPPFLTFVMSL